MKPIYSLFVFLFLFSNLFAQEKTNSEPVQKRNVEARSLTENASPVIDGNLDDEAWNLVEWQGNFVQRSPNEGEAASQKSQFKVTYDQRNIYFAIRCFDTEPDKIEKRLSRRDRYEGDWVIFSIDSYNDKRTAFCFNVNAAGVKSDEILSQDGNGSDLNWNPIWYTKTQIDAEGWTAELKIPFSQLRFEKGTEHLWGLQVTRMVFRENERDVWQRIPLDAAGWVSNFGSLSGLKNISTKKQIELQPYALSSIKTYEKQEGNPFKSGKDFNTSVGLDGKIGISNNMILDFTINPDFGQVEADPAAISLDGFQIFQNERRPFFIENSNLFDYRFSYTRPGNTFGFDNLFYSRRIGKTPSGYPSIAEGEHVDMPDNTTILGAAKISGQTKDGWSFGLLETITNKEYAKIESDGEIRKEIVEPLTNYTVARLQKNFNNQNSQIGGILTSTNRKLEGNLDFLHKNAYTGGIDFLHQWKDRYWYVEGNSVVSHVSGSKEAISNTQQSIGHLFQRPDAPHVEVDTNKTHLIGNGGTIKLGKTGGSPIGFETGFTWRTPGLELNDLGFQRQADDIRHFAGIGYQFRKPFSVFNRINLNYNHWLRGDFGGNFNGLAWNINAYANFKNNWDMMIGNNITPISYSISELRGGPRFKYVPQQSPFLWIESNDRKKLYAGINLAGDLAKDEALQYAYLNAYMVYQPINNLNLSLGAFYNTGKKELQYVDQTVFENENEYLVGKMNQQTTGLSLRVNYTLNPNLSLEYYGEPYITNGQFSNFKNISNPTAKNYSDKFIPITESQTQLSTDASYYSIDHNADGNMDYTIGNPDFNYVQFRSNLVLRWEYKPGSEFYFVWSQGATGFGNPQEQLVKNLGNEIFGKPLENIFLVKATYRLGL